MRRLPRRRRNLSEVFPSSGAGVPLAGRHPLFFPFSTKYRSNALILTPFLASFQQDSSPPSPKDGGGSKPPAKELSPYRRRDPIPPSYYAGADPHPQSEIRCLFPRFVSLSIPNWPPKNPPPPRAAKVRRVAVPSLSPGRPSVPWDPSSSIRRSRSSAQYVIT